MCLETHVADETKTTLPKKKCVFTVIRPTLIFASESMNFYTEFG